jgi:SAM-dependent methyltransferase
MQIDSSVYYNGVYWNDYELVRSYINRTISGSSSINWALHFLSLKGVSEAALILNCGNGWVERDLYQQGLFQRGVGIDISPTLLGEARKAAEAENMPLEYLEADINNDPFPIGGFDLVVNHAAAHHIAMIDKVFRSICAALPARGTFVSFDYVGPHRNQYTTEAWQRAWEFNHALPGEAKHPNLNYPHYPTMLITDPSEAVHSELIKETFDRYFTLGEWIPLGGALAYPLLTHNTSIADLPRDEADNYIREILRADAQFTQENPQSSLFAFFMEHRIRMCSPMYNFLRNGQPKRWRESLKPLRPEGCTTDLGLFSICMKE